MTGSPEYRRSPRARSETVYSFRIIMANKSTIRITSVNRPQLVFTPAVTRNDLARLPSEPTRLEERAIKSLQYIEEENQSAKTRRAKAVVMPEADQRWSFHHTLEIYRRNQCVDRGLCTRAIWNQNERLDVRWNEFSWEMNIIHVRRLVMLNMAGSEHAYWLVRLVHPGENPNVLGYAPDTTLRVFRYAVPLTGIANSDTGRLIGHSDFGLTSSDSSPDYSWRP